MTTDATTADEFQAKALTATGLLGATGQGRFLGLIAAAPSSGAHLRGDFYVTPTGSFIACTTAGTPGVFAESTAYVDAAVAALIGAAPSLLNTLEEIDNQLASDESVAAALATTVAGKVDKSTLTTDGDLYTRASGAVARMTRSALAADPAFTGAFDAAGAAASAQAASLPAAGGTSTGKQVFSKGIEITDDDGATSVDGYRALAFIEPPNADPEVVGIALKIPGTAWGVSQDYAEGNFIVALSDADNFVATPTNILKTITATTNATPVAVTTAAHGFSTGDVVRITGTGIAALDNKWWKITVTSTTVFTLNGSTAPGSTSSVGSAFSDRSPVLSRLADSGLGLTGAIHLAASLRGRAGSATGTQAVWIQPHNDMVGIILENPASTVWASTPTQDFLRLTDVRSSPSRQLFTVESDGTTTIRPQTGKSAGSVVLRTRKSDDSADALYVDVSGNLTTVGTNVTAGKGLAVESTLGNFFGLPAVAFISGAGGSYDSGIARNGVGIVRMVNLAEFPKVTAPSNGAANTGRLYVEDNGSGKMRLVVKFPTGSGIVLATEV